ncbi:alpha-protein kinase vwkA-like [Halichondria panicea]|uniref:alpha-protein kinase vwkA-like n=1 Tax=Halichondria panicea TaxID=6063 RepID=UPI00312B76A9
MAVVNFEPQHFAEGRFRYAYKGHYTAPPHKAGKPCVVKKMKESYTWKHTDWSETLQILETSKQLAVGFNKYSETKYPVKFVDVEVSPVTQIRDKTAYKLQEYLTVEDYIPGDYMKWCNNYGFIDTRDVLMPAFAHWSWAHTKGEKMIADLQGVRNDTGYIPPYVLPSGSYILTDPCLLSNTYGGKYGSTDTGIEGIAMFFLNHTCTDFCINLRKPSLANIPKHMLDKALGIKSSIGTSTAYSHEITFPKDIRNTLITLFKRIANTATV